VAIAQVTIHSSQFPEQVRRDLLESLRSRRVNHKFHYDSVKQTQKWLALHEAFSPARTDADCLATYDRSFAETARQMDTPEVRVIGLGCGGGQKDVRLLQLLKEAGRKTSYTPSDVSMAMVLTAVAAALPVVNDAQCQPLVCDLATAEDLPAVLQSQPGVGARLITFFGMIPNFEPKMILPKLAAIVLPPDHLLFSANLAPGDDYDAGVRQVLPLYDNEPTREWLITFLLDLGVERGDGDIRFTIEDDSNGLKRIVARFHFGRARKILVEQEEFAFAADEYIRLFFSYRHTPVNIRSLLERHGLTVKQEWIAGSGEEGIFLCRKK
jgi:L-histidine N-alpha-methyltransferase